ncbi:MAG TPA: hypothetical protein ENG66_00030 [Thermococcus sp.]|nr:hypothetical protein [Thermococcus sp.]
MEVYTSKYCKPCKILKKFLSKLKIKYREISIDNEEGMRRFMMLGVDGIPTLVFKDGFVLEGCPRDIEVLKKLVREHEKA